MRQRVRRTLGLAIVAVAGLILVVGCASPAPSRTDSPSATPACPVTLAAAPEAVPAPVAAFINGGMILPPGTTPPPLREMYGNAALWVVLGTTDGRLVGSADATGRLGAKFPTYRLVTGPLTVTARRLDGPSDGVATSVPEGYGPSGFQAVGVDFSSIGCWSITETVAGHDLTFVVEVVRSPSPT